MSVHSKYKSFIYNEHNYSKCLVTSTDHKCNKIPFYSIKRSFKCDINNCGQYFSTEYHLAVHQKWIHWKPKTVSPLLAESHLTGKILKSLRRRKISHLAE